MFRSLRSVDYRWWFFAAFVSNIGVWMHRIAQDWVVLTELTDGDALALGISTALQFGPMLLLTPVAGTIADHIDKRIVIFAAESTQAVLALTLGLLVLFGHPQLWQLYLFAGLLGVVNALGLPARQTFVTELVEPGYLTNAVALNIMSFQSARLVGPAVAGGLIAAIGVGPVFLVNSATFLTVIGVLFIVRRVAAADADAAAEYHRGLLGALRYIRERGDLLIVLSIVLLVGAFALNMPMYVVLMATDEFGLGASEFGLLSSVLAIGAIMGSLLAARMPSARPGMVISAALVYAVAAAGLTLTRDEWQFGAVLVLVGGATLTLSVQANSYLQVMVNPELRGRVMGVYLAIYTGATPLGAPLIGMVANSFGPRAALGLAVGSGLLAFLLGFVWLVRRGGLELRTLRPRFRQTRSPSAESPK